MKLRSKLLFAGVVVGGVAVFASSSMSEVAHVPQVYSLTTNNDLSMTLFSTYDYKLLYEHWHDNITSLNAVYSANCSPAGN